MHSVRVSPQAMRKQRIVSLSRSWYVCFSAYWIGIVPGGPNEGFVLTTCKRAFWATQSTFRYLEMHVGNWDSADVGITCFCFWKTPPPPPPPTIYLSSSKILNVFWCSAILEDHLKKVYDCVRFIHSDAETRELLENWISSVERLSCAACLVKQWNVVRSGGRRS